MHHFNNFTSIFYIVLFFLFLYFHIVHESFGLFIPFLLFNQSHTQSFMPWFILFSFWACLSFLLFYFVCQCFLIITILLGYLCSFNCFFLYFMHQSFISFIHINNNNLPSLHTITIIKIIE